MKITINPKNLTIDESWNFYRKVRAVIENDQGEIIITTEDGKVIFPGGKCDKDEDNIDAIKREILEETGIDIPKEEFRKCFELETIYDEFWDVRTNTKTKRHTTMTYYYVKTSKDINYDKLMLTEQEKSSNFKIAYVDKNTLLNMINTDHSHLQNGKYFDEENKIVVEKIINNLK